MDRRQVTHQTLVNDVRTQPDAGRRCLDHNGLDLLSVSKFKAFRDAGFRGYRYRGDSYPQNACGISDLLLKNADHRARSV